MMKLQTNCSPKNISNISQIEIVLFVSKIPWSMKECNCINNYVTRKELLEKYIKCFVNTNRAFRLQKFPAGKNVIVLMIQKPRKNPRFLHKHRPTSLLSYEEKITKRFLVRMKSWKTILFLMNSMVSDQITQQNNRH